MMTEFHWTAALTHGYRTHGICSLLCVHYLASSSITVVKKSYTLYNNSTFTFVSS